MVKTANGWIPERRAIIWIDCNPQVGQEMRDVHPFLVLFLFVQVCERLNQIIQIA